MWKKLTALVLALALLPAAAFAAPTPNIKVTYNEKAIQFPDQKPVILNQRTLVPIRPIAEGLGFKVSWNEKTRTVGITKEKNSVSLVISQKIAKRNGETITLDVPAQIINQRTVVPVRFIAEALNYKVDWDQATQTVKVADKAVEAPTTTQPGTTTPTTPATPVTKVELIDKDSIIARSINIGGAIGAYRVAGEVDSSTKKLVVVMNGQTYDVNVESDGKFDFTVNTDPEIEDFTIRATKDEGEDTYEGEFEAQ